MKFMVNTIVSETAKARLVSFSFVDTEIPEDFTFSTYVPKSLELKVGEVNNLPKWIVDGFYGRNYYYVLQALTKQARKAAKRGKKDAAEIEIREKLLASQELNIEEPEEPKEITGSFIGKPGEFKVDYFIVEGCFYSDTRRLNGIWNNSRGYGWEHPIVEKCGWILRDRNGNTVVCFSGNEYVNNTLDYAAQKKSEILLNAEITKTSVYHGVRQTMIRLIRKSFLEVPKEEKAAIEENLEPSLMIEEPSTPF